MKLLAVSAYSCFHSHCLKEILSEINYNHFKVYQGDDSDETNMKEEAKRQGNFL